MAVNNIVKRIQNIMRQDAGVNGDAQRIEQMTWMFFLKVYDTQEETWEYKAYREGKTYVSIIPEELRWRNWAVDEKDGKALTGDALLALVNDRLFPTLKNIEVTRETPRSKAIVKDVFEDINQYMKNGTLLRQVINVIPFVWGHLRRHPEGLAVCRKCRRVLYPTCFDRFHSGNVASAFG